MKTLVALPIVIPLMTAALLLALWPWPRLHRWLTVAGAAALFAVSLLLFASVRTHGILVLQPGEWPAPYGITLVADLFSAIMIMMAGLIGVLLAIFSIGSVDPRRQAFGYFPLLNVLLMGVCGSFLTGDMFNLFVWFEVMLIASFVLMALGGERPQIEGGLKYVTINLVSSAILLAAAGLLYGTAGTLNMADLARSLPLLENQALVTTVGMLFLMTFGIKAAVFPLFFWLPAAYHTPPVAVTALLGGLLTKVGVYALIRVFTLVFTHDPGYIHTLILVIAGITMVTGVLGAVAQTDVRRLLSFHIISQIGYMIMGLGLFTAAGLAASVFFIVHASLAKTSLFLVSGVAYHLRGTYDLKKLGGLYVSHPGLAVLFLVSALALAGLPPLSGFVGKLALVQAGLAAASYPIVITSLAVSLLTLFSMMKIWAEAFWKAPPEAPRADPIAPAQRGLLVAPVLVLALVAVALGVGAGPVFEVALEAGRQLMRPELYVEAVMAP